MIRKTRNRWSVLLAALVLALGVLPAFAGGHPEDGWNTGPKDQTPLMNSIFAVQAKDGSFWIIRIEAGVPKGAKAGALHCSDTSIAVTDTVYVGVECAGIPDHNRVPVMMRVYYAESDSPEEMAAARIQCRDVFIPAPGKVYGCEFANSHWRT